MRSRRALERARALGTVFALLIIVFIVNCQPVVMPSRPPQQQREHMSKLYHGIVLSQFQQRRIAKQRPLFLAVFFFLVQGNNARKRAAAHFQRHRRLGCQRWRAVWLLKQAFFHSMATPLLGTYRQRRISDVYE
jgi:hypothetical protein